MPRDLTQVEMRKLELARAVAAEPKLLIADESMAGLSHSEIEDILKLLKTLNRSEEHTSELQSPCNLVCRLLLEKKNKNKNQQRTMPATSTDGPLSSRLSNVRPTL